MPRRESRRERIQRQRQERLDKANAATTGGGGPGGSTPYSNKPVDEIDANAQMWEDRDSAGPGVKQWRTEDSSGNVTWSDTDPTLLTGSNSPTATTNPTQSGQTDELSTSLSSYVKNFDSTGTTQDNTGST